MTLFPVDPVLCRCTTTALICGAWDVCSPVWSFRRNPSSMDKTTTTRSLSLTVRIILTNHTSSSQWDRITHSTTILSSVWKKVFHTHCCPTAECCLSLAGAHRQSSGHRRAVRLPAEIPHWTGPTFQRPTWTVSEDLFIGPHFKSPQDSRDDLQNLQCNVFSHSDLLFFSLHSLLGHDMDLSTDPQKMPGQSTG